MKYESFLASVAQRASIATDQADTATIATLQTLAERLTAGEALDLAAQLPKPMQAALRPPTEAAHRFGADEFVGRVADRCGTNAAQAKRAVRAVFATLREAISSGEFDDIMGQLPKDFADIVEPVTAPARPGRRG